MNVLITWMMANGLLLVGASKNGGATRLAVDVPATRVPHADRDSTLNAVVDEYCVGCHSDRRLRGNMSLEGFDVASPERHGQIAERTIHKLRAGMMPPAPAKQPPEGALSLLATSLEDRLDELEGRIRTPATARSSA